jgi:hypothetical protein
MPVIAADVVRFLNDLTDGDLLGWKVVLTTVAFALAGLQVAMAAQFWGVLALPFLDGRRAVVVHRAAGTVTLLLALAVAFSCLVGPAGATSPTRVLLHSIFGSALFVVLALKFAFLKLVPGGDRALPVLGSLLFLLFLAIWLTSVADYISR